MAQYIEQGPDHRPVDDINTIRNFAQLPQWTPTKHGCYHAFPVRQEQQEQDDKKNSVEGAAERCPEKRIPLNHTVQHDQ